MIWLMPIKTAHHSVLWPGAHRKQGLLPAAACPGSWPVWADPSLRPRVSEHTADPTSHGNTKAILCRCCRFSTLSLAYKTKMYNHTDQPRTLPPDALSLQVFFSFLSVLGGTVAEREAVLFTMCAALIPRSVSVSVLDSLFLSPFLFIPSFSVPAPASPFLLSSILLFPRHSECYSEMCLHRTHTPRALNAREEDVLPRNFPARQHCCPSHQARTKGTLFSCPLFAGGSSGNERNDSLPVCRDRCKNDHKRRRWQTLTGKPDLTLTVFLMKICVGIRCCRHG